MNSFFQAFFLDEDGDVDPELMLAKKKAMDNAKTPVAAPEVADTKPVKKADTPAAEKKPATKESKPVNRDGKPCTEKSYRKSFAKEKELKQPIGMFLWFVILFIWSSVLTDLYLFGTLLLSKTIEKPS